MHYMLWFAYTILRQTLPFTFSSLSKQFHALHVLKAFACAHWVSCCIASCVYVWDAREHILARLFARISVGIVIMKHLQPC
jgi:hypothetical protein